MLPTEATIDTSDTPPPTNPNRYHFETETMKPNRKRVGSLLCFSAPVTTDESETTTEKRHRPSDPVKEEGTKRKKSKHFRVLSNILRFISIRSNSSRVKSRKDRNRSLSLRKISNPFDVQTTIDTSPHSLLFSSSLSSSCSSSSSSSSLTSSSLSSSRMSSSIGAVASEFAPKGKGKMTFMPPQAWKSIVCLVLLSLFVLVFCGRLFAIVFTATWLCLMPCRRGGAKVDDVAAAAERRRKAGENREGEKRRVVLEGFLHRNRKDL